MSEDTQTTGDIEVVRNDEAGRYEVVVDGTVAGFTEFEQDDAGRLVFPHTVVDPAFSGRGLATTLVGAAMEDVAARGETVVPVCLFVEVPAGSRCSGPEDPLARARCRGGGAGSRPRADPRRRGRRARVSPPMTRLGDGPADLAVATESPTDCDGPRALLLEAREVPLGGVRGMSVHRSLPQRALPMVGSWCFLDRFGPQTARMRVEPHPTSACRR